MSVDCVIESRVSPFLLILRMWNTAGEIFSFPLSRTLISFWERARYRGIPSPLPTRSRARRGFCKNRLQNIERVAVRGQNPDFKDLMSVSGPLRRPLSPWQSSTFQASGARSHVTRDLLKPLLRDPQRGRLQNPVGDRTCHPPDHFLVQNSLKNSCGHSKRRSMPLFQTESSSA